MNEKLKQKIKAVSGLDIKQNGREPEKYKFIERGNYLGQVQIIDGEPNLMELYGPLNKSELEGFFVAFREIERAG